MSNSDFEKEAEDSLNRESSLPQIEKPKKHLAKFYAVFAFVFISFTCVVGAVAYYFDFFGNEQHLTITKEFDVNRQLDSNIFDSSDELIESSYNDDSSLNTTSLPPIDSSAEIETSLEVNTEKLDARIDELSTKIVSNNQDVQQIALKLDLLVNQYDLESKQLRQLLEQLSKQVKFNSESLTKSNVISQTIIDQLQNVGLKIDTQKNRFPLLVYSKSIWGGKTFLNVAQSDYPEQSMQLEVGNSLLGWELLKLETGKAIFRSVDGKIKEVEL